MKRKIQMEHKRKPKKWEANQLATLQVLRGFELWTNENKMWPGWDLKLGPSDYQSSALTARPCCLQSIRSNNSTVIRIILYNDLLQPMLSGKL